jgi:hypothetical protein
MHSTRNVVTWATALSTNSSNARKIIFRYAETINPSFDPASQPDRIMIIWRYKSSTGQPSTEEYQQMTLLEESLEPIEDAGRFATLVLVSTGECLREWTYYARSGDKFVHRLNVALTAMPLFPIEIHVASDSAWRTYFQFKDGVRRKTTN